MCQFKSGIILKNKVVLAPEGNDSHSDLLESLGIEDDRMNAMKVFVRAEFLQMEIKLFLLMNGISMLIKILHRTGLMMIEENMRQNSVMQLKNI